MLTISLIAILGIGGSFAARNWARHKSGTVAQSEATPDDNKFPLSVPVMPGMTFNPNSPYPVGKTTQLIYGGQATQFVYGGQTNQFITASPTADIVAYYEKEMPNLGWTFQMHPTLRDETAVSFFNDKQWLHILIKSPDSGSGCTVTISFRLK
jgi:hypothetical protein